MELVDEQYLSLRTFRRTGKPVDTPVWFASESPSVHYIFSAAEAGKVKRLRHTARVQVTRCNASGSALGAWQDAEGFLVDTTDESARAYELLQQKYGWQMTLTNFFSRLSGRINNRQVIRIEMPG